MKRSLVSIVLVSLLSPLWAQIFVPLPAHAQVTACDNATQSCWAESKEAAVVVYLARTLDQTIPAEERLMVASQDAVAAVLNGTTETEPDFLGLPDTDKEVATLIALTAISELPGMNQFTLGQVGGFMIGYFNVDGTTLDEIKAVTTTVVQFFCPNLTEGLLRTILGAVNESSYETAEVLEIPGYEPSQAAQDRMAAILDAMLFASTCPPQELPGPDDDDDGLPNTYEEQMGTDPNDPDSNGNGINDGEESGLLNETNLFEDYNTANSFMSSLAGIFATAWGLASTIKGAINWFMSFFGQGPSSTFFETAPTGTEQGDFINVGLTEGLFAGYPWQILRVETTKDAFRVLTNFMLGFVGIISLIFLVLGGYYYVTAHGDEGQMEKGKKIIIGAVIGMFVVMASYVIVSAILNFGVRFRF